MAVIATAWAVRRRVAALGGDGDGPAPMARHVGLEGRLRRLGLPGEPRTQLHLAVALGMAPIAAWVFAGTAAAGAVVIAGLTGLVVWRRGASARRLAADERELPHLLERVARHLRSGGSLAQALVAASPPPSRGGAPSEGLAEAWRAVADRSVAVGTVAALDEWAESARRRATPSVGLAAAALAVAASTGGSPARAVDGVASTLRSRLAVAEEVRALASQSRASAIVIALAPVGFGALAAATDDRTADFLGTPAGVAVVAAGLLLDAAGAWWMARLCRVPS